MTTLEYPTPVNVNFDAVDKAIVFIRGIFPSNKIIHKYLCQSNPDNEPRKVSPYRHQHKELAKVIRDLKIHKNKTIEIVNHYIEQTRFHDKIISLNALMFEKFVVKGSKKKRAWIKEQAEKIGLEYHQINL